MPKDRLVVENGRRLGEGRARPARSPTARSRRARRIARTVDEKAVLRAVARVHGHGPLAPPARRRRQGHGRREVRRRHPPARPAARADPAPARARRDPRPGRHLRGREAGRRDGREPGRASSPCCTPTRRSRRRPSGACGRSGTPPRRGRTRTGIFDDLLGRAPAAGGEGRQGRRGGGPRARRRRRFESTYQKGYVAHAPMEPHASTATFENGKLDGLGLDPDALPDPRPARAGPRARPEERPGHHALRRRRLRRQELRPPVRGGGAPREDHRAAGAGGLDPRRGVLLRHVRPGLRS